MTNRRKVADETSREIVAGILADFPDLFDEDEIKEYRRDLREDIYWSEYESGR